MQIYHFLVIGFAHAAPGATPADAYATLMAGPYCRSCRPGPHWCLRDGDLGPVAERHTTLVREAKAFTR
jgi:hypothetical protein